MKTALRWTVSLLIAVATVAIAAPHIFSREDAATAAQKNATSGQQSPVERGRYLVEEVAMCGECHTPRDANGEIDNARPLQGAPIWIMPVHPDTHWAMRAPALAGLPGFSDAQAEQILERGRGPTGWPFSRRCTSITWTTRTRPPSSRT